MKEFTRALGCSAKRESAGELTIFEGAVTGMGREL